VRDIKTLTRRFTSCIFKHVRRSSNVVAHRLARSSEHLVCNVFVRVIPNFIPFELSNDVK
jgi:hypothetical protein